MSLVKGVVQAISEKAGPRGPASNIKVDDTWYGCGFVAASSLPCKKGDTVSFTFTERGQYKNVDMKSMQVTPAAAAQASSGGGGGGDKRNWDEKNRLDEERQRAISFQSCRNSAIEVTKLLVQLEAITLPKTKGDVEGALVGYIDDLTNKYYDDTVAVARGAVSQDDSEEFAE